MSLFPKLKNIHMQMCIIDLCLEYSFFKSQQNCYVWRILSLEPQKIKEAGSTAVENGTRPTAQTGFEYVSSAFNYLTNMEILNLSRFFFSKENIFTQSQQQPAPLSLWAPGILRLQTESLNIGAPSKHLGLVLEYFTQELRIFY